MFASCVIKMPGHGFSLILVEDCCKKCSMMGLNVDFFSKNLFFGEIPDFLAQAGGKV